MESNVPRQVDTVVVGNGPSALILSYILHGNVPVYDLSSPHPDHLLHQKLKDYQDLLAVDVDHVTEHFGASRFSYSTQALPINVLFDTLIRPYGETDDRENKTCIKWQYDPSRAVPHIVVGNAVQTGGQWVSNPVNASWDIGTLSYAGMLSLPGYDFGSYYLEQYGKELPLCFRPSRREVAEYFAVYPHRAGIADAIYYGETLSGIRRTSSGFYIASHKLFCSHLVLASGVFTRPILPNPPLRSLLSLSDSSVSPNPLLVVGSGFSAADVILSTDPAQKIIHVYKWSPSKNPSPLKACHQQAYPEYAGVYRKMKLAAVAANQSKGGRPPARRGSSAAFDASRDWTGTYEGLPNAVILDAKLDGGSALVTFQVGSNTTFQRRVSGLSYVIGRRGSLEYLEPILRGEVCPRYDAAQGLSGRDLREKANEDLEIANSVFIIGSLAGDTLIRFSYGGCAYAAGKILENIKLRNSPKQEPQFKCSCKEHGGRSSPSFVPSMHGLDGHGHSPSHGHSHGHGHDPAGLWRDIVSARRSEVML